MSYPTMDDYEELWALHFAAEEETDIEARRIDRPTIDIVTYT